MSADILQNPSDPDATYRSKAGKSYKGYSANLVEAVDEKGSVIVDYNIWKRLKFPKNHPLSLRMVHMPVKRLPDLLPIKTEALRRHNRIKYPVITLFHLKT